MKTGLTELAGLGFPVMNPENPVNPVRFLRLSGSAVQNK
jgi:hypothetical protein